MATASCIRESSYLAILYRPLTSLADAPSSPPSAASTSCSSFPSSSAACSASSRLCCACWSASSRGFSSSSCARWSSVSLSCASTRGWTHGGRPGAGRGVRLHTRVLHHADDLSLLEGGRDRRRPIDGLRLVEGDAVTIHAHAVERVSHGELLHTRLIGHVGHQLCARRGAGRVSGAERPAEAAREQPTGSPCTGNPCPNLQRTRAWKRRKIDVEVDHHRLIRHSAAGRTREWATARDAGQCDGILTCRHRVCRPSPLHGRRTTPRGIG